MDLYTYCDGPGKPVVVATDGGLIEELSPEDARTLGHDLLAKADFSDLGGA